MISIEIKCDSGWAVRLMSCVKTICKRRNRDTYEVSNFRPGESEFVQLTHNNRLGALRNSSVRVSFVERIFEIPPTNPR